MGASRHICRVHGRCVSIFPASPPPFRAAGPTYPSRASRFPLANVFFSLAQRCSCNLQTRRDFTLAPPASSLPTTSLLRRFLVASFASFVAALFAISCAPCLPRLGNTSRPSRTNSGTITLSIRMLHHCRRCPSLPGYPGLSRTTAVGWNRLRRRQRSEARGGFVLSSFPNTHLLCAPLCAMRFRRGEKSPF